MQICNNEAAMEHPRKLRSSREEAREKEAGMEGDSQGGRGQ